MGEAQQPPEKSNTPPPSRNRSGLLVAGIVLFALSLPIGVGLIFAREPWEQPGTAEPSGTDHESHGASELPRQDTPGPIEQGYDDLEAARPLRGPSPNPIPDRIVSAPREPDEPIMEIAGIPLPPPRPDAPANRRLFLESPESLVVKRLGPPTRIVREVRTADIHIKICQWYFFDPFQILDARFENGYLAAFQYTDIATASEQQREWMLNNAETVEGVSLAYRTVQGLRDQRIVTLIQPKGARTLGVYTNDVWYRIPDDKKEVVSYALLLYGLLEHGTTMVSYLDWEIGVETGIATPSGGYRWVLGDD